MSSSVGATILTSFRSTALGAALAGLTYSGAQAAAVTIDLSSGSSLRVGSAAQASSFDYDLSRLGGGVVDLLDSLGFSGATPYYLRATATSSSASSAPPLLMANADGLSVCSRDAASPCGETGNGADFIDGQGNGSNPPGADWEGVAFSLLGAPAGFKFYLANATFTGVGTGAALDDVAVRETSGTGGAYHISDGTCTGVGGDRECSFSFLPAPGLLGEGFELRALDENDAWRLSSITWELQPSQVGPIPAVPEPATLTVFGLGLLGLGLAGRRTARG
jgi:hypothetical protein